MLVVCDAWVAWLCGTWNDIIVELSGICESMQCLGGAKTASDRKCVRTSRMLLQSRPWWNRNFTFTLAVQFWDLRRYAGLLIGMTCAAETWVTCSVKLAVLFLAFSPQIHVLGRHYFGRVTAVCILRDATSCEYTWHGTLFVDWRLADGFERIKFSCFWSFESSQRETRLWHSAVNVAHCCRACSSRQGREVDLVVAAFMWGRRIVVWILGLWIQSWYRNFWMRSGDSRSWLMFAQSASRALRIAG